MEEEDESKLWSDSQDFDDNMDAWDEEESGELKQQEATEQAKQPANENGQTNKIAEPGATTDSMIETYDEVIMFFGTPLVVKQ